jgi:hypothetical protein
MRSLQRSRSVVGTTVVSICDYEPIGVGVQVYCLEWVRIKYRDARMMSQVRVYCTI